MLSYIDENSHSTAYTYDLYLNLTMGGIIIMNIKKRKLRLVGNSVVISVSTEFLAENNLNIGDTVFLDEDKLKDAITKKSLMIQK